MAFFLITFYTHLCLKTLHVLAFLSFSRLACMLFLPPYASSATVRAFIFFYLATFFYSLILYTGLCKRS